MIFLISTITDDKVRIEVANLYEKYSKSCYYKAYSITGNEQHAKDVLQTVFERLIVFLDCHTLKDINNPKGFLIVIVRREAINLMNKHMNKNEKLTDSIEDYEITSDNEPLMNVLRLDQAGKFLKKLELIKLSYAEIIVLKYAKEFTDEEIGELLNLTPANVRMRLTRARRAYEKMLKRGDDDE